jgi:hypothetical protein
MPDTTGVVERTRRERNKAGEAPNTRSVEAGKYIRAARTAGTGMNKTTMFACHPFSGPRTLYGRKSYCGQEIQSQRREG